MVNDISLIFFFRGKNQRVAKPPDTLFYLAINYHTRSSHFSFTFSIAELTRTPARDSRKHTHTPETKTSFTKDDSNKTLLLLQALFHCHLKQGAHQSPFNKINKRHTEETMNYLRHQSSSHVASAAATSNITNSSNLSSSSSEHANAPSTTTTGPPLGMRTPSRVKRARYNVDPPEMYASEHQEQQRRQQEAQIQQQQQQRVTMSTSAGAGGSGGAVSSSYSQGSILTELEETRRLVRAFDTIDTSMTEARDKLKVRQPT
jgi:hypothetical protein